MTTKWTIPPDLFAGQTVAVLASGPSLTQELADSVRHLPRICARWACKRAPDAEYCIAVDGPPNLDFWPYALENFNGTLITAVETDALPERVKYFWHRWEMVTISEVPSHVIEFRNNGMSAIHLAEHGGATKILLLGFDPMDPRHFYDDVIGYPDMNQEWYFGLTKGLEQLTAKLRANGIEVVDIKTMDDVREHVPGASQASSASIPYDLADTDQLESTPSSRKRNRFE